MRDAVDGVRALLGILERSVAAQELRPLRDALSQLQMAYAREAQAGGGEPSAQQRPAGESSAPVAEGKTGAPTAADKPDAPPTDGKPGAGPAESSGRLWVPGSLRTLSRGRHDRLRPPFRRESALTSEPGDIRTTREILARHANKTAEDFC